MILKLPTSSVRKIDIENTRLHMAVVELKDLPFEILEWDKLRKDKNSADTALTDSIRSNILADAESNSDMFIFKHRGIEFSAKEVIYKDKRNQLPYLKSEGKKVNRYDLYLDLDDEALHGIIDGKFTLQTLKGTESTAPIQVRIWEGLTDSDLVADMAYDR